MGHPRSKRARRATILMLLLVPVVACSGDDGDDADADIAPATEDGGGGTGLGATVELLDPGAEPRQVLRLAPADDCAQALVQETKIELELAVAGETQMIDQGQRAEVDVRCTEVTDERIRIETEYGDVTSLASDPAAADVATQVADQLVGQSAKAEYDRRGQLLDYDAPDVDFSEVELGDDLPAGFTAAMQGMLEGFESAAEQGATPFPSEAIGLGGRWTVRAEVAVSGIDTVLTTTYTVTELTAERVVATTSATMEFLPGPVELGVAGATGEVVSGTFSGEGSTTWELDQPLPHYTQALDGNVVLRVGSGADAVELGQRQRQHSSQLPR